MGCHHRSVLFLALFMFSLALVSSKGQKHGICIEKISDIAAIYMQEHPAGGQAVVGTQRGLMTLVTLPPVGTNFSIHVSTWLDLTDRAMFDNNERGLLSFAFHPKFAQNGRFFVSYLCDSEKHPDCQGPCACNKETNCTLGELDSTCTSNTIISEYWAGPNPLKATALKPKEVRKIFHYGRPYMWHNGGHIFFGKDGYLYVSSGDGGNEGDPWNFAMQPNTFLGKILRVDVDNIPKGQPFGIPPTNPFLKSKGAHPAIYALGLRQPWRCDQDPISQAIFCGDVGGNQVEEINWIRPGHNYQWHNIEGSIKLDPAELTQKIFTPTQMQLGVQTGPVFQYAHSCEGIKKTSNCVEESLFGGNAVIGGVFYSTTKINKCLKGQYLYSDVSGPMWVADPHKKKTRRVNVKCSPTTPLPCTGMERHFSWARDLEGNAYVLDMFGVHRVTQAEHCGFVC